MYGRGNGTASSNWVDFQIHLEVINQQISWLKDRQSQEETTLRECFNREGRQGKGECSQQGAAVAVAEAGVA